jgi:hypothetical protein
MLRDFLEKEIEIRIDFEKKQQKHQSTCFSEFT